MVAARTRTYVDQGSKTASQARHRPVPCGVRAAHAERSFRDGDARSGCASHVAMMQSADHREGDGLPPFAGLALARFGSALVEREVGPGAMIVLEVSPQDAPQVLLSRTITWSMHSLRRVPITRSQ